MQCSKELKPRGRNKVSRVRIRDHPDFEADGEGTHSSGLWTTRYCGRLLWTSGWLNLAQAEAPLPTAWPWEMYDCATWDLGSRLVRGVFVFSSYLSLADGRGNSQARAVDISTSRIQDPCGMAGGYWSISDLCLHCRTTLCQQEYGSISDSQPDFVSEGLNALHAERFIAFIVSGAKKLKCVYYSRVQGER